MNSFYTNDLKQVDTEVYSSLSKELQRQENVIELIVNNIKN